MAASPHLPNPVTPGVRDGGNKMTERRIVICNLRATSANAGPMRITGMAARYNVPAKIGTQKGSFIERIMPGAFRSALKRGDDVALQPRPEGNRRERRVLAASRL